jgi:hypothetical protein
MTVTTLVTQAQKRVERERDAIADLEQGYSRFTSQVRDVSVQPDRPQPTPEATSGATPAVRSQATDGCKQIRQLFADTIQPHSGVDLDHSESLMETIAEECGRDVALLLAPTAGNQFTSDVKQAVLAATTQRQAEIEAFQRALDREAEALETAADDLAVVTDWLVDADEIPLTDLGFDSLQDRHEMLDAHRERCSTVARRRQKLLEQTTASAGQAAIGHHSLVRHLYTDLPVTHPVLVTAARLDDLCGSCQRTVRKHLTRRA